MGLGQDQEDRRAGGGGRPHRSGRDHRAIPTAGPPGRRRPRRWRPHSPARVPAGPRPPGLDAAGHHAGSAEGPQKLPLAAVGVEHLGGGRRRHHVVDHRLHPLPQLPRRDQPRRALDRAVLPGQPLLERAAPGPRGNGTPRRPGPWPRGPHSAASSGSPLRRRPDTPRRPPGAAEASSNAVSSEAPGVEGPKRSPIWVKLARKFHVSLPCGRRRAKAAFSASVAPSCPAGGAPSSAGSPGSGTWRRHRAAYYLAPCLHFSVAATGAALTSPGPPEGVRRQKGESVIR